MSDQVAPRETTPQYSERLTVPIRWWVQATMFLATIWIAFIVATPAWLAWGATGICVLLTVLMFVQIGNARISVHDGVLYAGDARIDLRFLETPEVLDAEQTRLAAGRDADVRAFILIRPYLKQSVRIPLNDPRDPAPHWLLACRRPGQLAAVLSTAIAHRGPSTPQG